MTLFYTETPLTTEINEVSQLKNFLNKSIDGTIKIKGDKMLLKRIMYLKESLEMDPHLDENQAMFRELISEHRKHRSSHVSENKPSPRTKRDHNKSVVPNDSVPFSKLILVF